MGLSMFQGQPHYHWFVWLLTGAWERFSLSHISPEIPQGDGVVGSRNIHVLCIRLRRLSPNSPELGVHLIPRGTMCALRALQIMRRFSLCENSLAHPKHPRWTVGALTTRLRIECYFLDVSLSAHPTKDCTLKIANLYRGIC